MQEYNGFKIDDLIIHPDFKGVWRIDSFTRRYWTKEILERYYSKDYDEELDIYVISGKIVRLGDEYSPWVNMTKICNDQGKPTIRTITELGNSTFIKPASELLNRVEAEYLALKTIIKK